MDATQGSVSPGDAAELQQLRRRAYGPDADIDADPSAQARLAELESLAHALSATPELDELPAPAEIPPGDRVEDNPDVVIAAVPPAEPAKQRWVLWLIAGALAVVCGIVLAAVFGVLPGAPTETLHVRAHVSVDGDDELAELAAPLRTATYLGIVKDDLVLYDDFRGMNVWSAPTVHGTTCLILTTRADGLRTVGCAPPGAEPQIELYKFGTVFVAETESEDVWGDLPAGSVVRIALRDGAVLVWDVPAPGPAPTFD